MNRDDETDLGRALRRLAAAGEDIAALRAQLAEAREVVRPFADSVYEDDVLKRLPPKRAFRAARALLAKLGE